MGAQRRIFREVDALSGLITLSLGFDNPLLEGFDSFLLLFDSLLLLIRLGLEFGDPSVEFTDSSGLRLSTPQQNRGDNPDWGLEFLDLCIP